MLVEISTGDWLANELMIDYRAERFSDMLVERATWAPAAAPLVIDDVTVGGPDYVWLRFWLLDRAQIVDKYFDASRQTIGMYAPLTLPFQDEDGKLTTVDLRLGLWLGSDGRVLVLQEDEFEADVIARRIDATAAQYAEQRIREMTIEIGQNLFPPAMVRNFTLKKPQEL